MTFTDTKRRRIRGAAGVACEALEPRRMMDTTSAQVLIESKFVEVNGTLSKSLGFSFHLHDVNGTMNLNGSNLAVQTSGNRINVTGVVTSIQNVALSNTTRNSSIVFRTTGSGVVDINSFTSTGPMGAIDLLDTNLTGNANIVAAPKVILGQGTQATIQVSDATNVRSSQVQLGNFSQSHFTCTQPLSSLQIGQWTGSESMITTGVALEVKAQVIDGNVTMNIAPKVAGLIDVPTIGPGDWNIIGAVNRFIAENTAPGWAANITSINHLDISGTASGSLTSNDINTFTASQMNGMMLDFPALPTSRGPVLNSLVARDIVNSHVFSENSFGSIRTDGLIDSSIFTGVIGTTALPTEASNFINNAMIDRLWIGGRRDSTGYRNSFVAAPILGQVDLDPLLLSSFPEIATKQINDLTVIPLLGHLFKAHHVNKESQLVIFVQPTIIIP